MAHMDLVPGDKIAQMVRKFFCKNDHPPHPAPPIIGGGGGKEFAPLLPNIRKNNHVGAYGIASAPVVEKRQQNNGHNFTLN